MSKIRLYGDTSGYLELDVPAVAGDRSLILPDVNGNFVLGSNTFKLPGSSGTLDSLNRAGNVLQVVQAATSTQASSSSSTYADTGLTATITPTSASSRVLVLVNQGGCAKTTNDTSLSLRLMRGALLVAQMEVTAGATNSLANNYIGSCSICYVDSPATTSAVTFKTQFASASNTTAVYTQVNSTASSTITLMEIAA